MPTIQLLNFACELLNLQQLIVTGCLESRQFEEMTVVVRLAGSQVQVDVVEFLLPVQCQVFSLLHSLHAVVRNGIGLQCTFEGVSWPDYLLIKYLLLRNHFMWMVINYFHINWFPTSSSWTVISWMSILSLFLSFSNLEILLFAWSRRPSSSATLALNLRLWIDYHLYSWLITYLN